MREGQRGGGGVVGEENMEYDEGGTSSFFLITGTEKGRVGSGQQNDGDRRWSQLEHPCTYRSAK